MNAYVDSSVVLRIVLGESGRLPAWRKLRRAISSQLVRIECLRTIDRARIRLGLADADVGLSVEGVSPSEAAAGRSCKGVVIPASPLGLVIEFGPS